MPKKYKYSTNVTIDGKRYKIRADSHAELARKINEKKEEASKLFNKIDGAMPVSVWAERCTDTYKVNLKPASLKNYRQLLRHCILEYIGDLRVRDVRPLDCQNVLNEQEGNSKRQINEVYNIMRFIFEKAVDNGMIAVNPAAKITKPNGTKTSRRALTPYERQKTLEVCDQDPRFVLFLLMMLCGCRPAEAGECKGYDIQIVEGYPMLHIRGTKTVLADRMVPIPAELYARIKDTPKDEYIAHTSTGQCFTRYNRRNLWHRFQREMNIAMGCRVYRNELIPPFPLADDLVPYCFRHEYCTDLARRGIDIRVAQKLMGHSDIKMTANIYTNLDHNDVIEAAKVLNGDIPRDTLRDTLSVIR